MEVKHVDDGKKGKFYIVKNGIQEAEMTYVYDGSATIIIAHTEVKEALKGQGIGYLLMASAIDFMRKNNIKAIPTCSYAAAVFKKKPEYAYRLA